MAAPWAGVRPDALRAVLDDPWRSNGDTVERIELLAIELVRDEAGAGAWDATTAVMDEIDDRIRPSIEACGKAEIDGLMTALDGRFVQPGPSGAPTRGRPTCCRRGAISTRSTAARCRRTGAWELGRKSAELLMTRHTRIMANGQPRWR
jgi:cobaltochelatase CobN